jgi:DNA polymerase
MMREALRQQYLQAMGVQLWESRIKTQAVEVHAVPETVEQIKALKPGLASASTTQTEPASDHAVLPDWPAFKSAVESCQKCILHQNRIFSVPGVGDTSARLMLVGEAPGAEEDRQGEPFVGRAGQLLNEMLLAIGYRREQVYITNLIKCRPPNNRDPHVDEVAACESFLRQQIQWVQPTLIVALGRFAAQNLLKTDASLGQLRGQLHSCQDFDIPVLVTYHPAYLLRKPLEKRKTWHDLNSVLACLQSGAQA